MNFAFAMGFIAGSTGGIHYRLFWNLYPRLFTNIDRQDNCKKSKSIPMKPLERESEVVIRFPDCDPFRHLNNSRYVDYF